MASLSYRPLIHKIIEQHAVLRPEHIAVDEGRRAISYADFVAQGNRIASTIRKTEPQRNARVGIFIDNSIEAYLAIFAILQADCCYVPLNTAMPPSRLAAVINLAEIHAIATVSAHLGTLHTALADATSPLDVILLDANRSDVASPPHGQRTGTANTWCADDIAGEPAVAPPSRNIREDIAYIIFTSGTTGNPKGVMISHGALLDFVNWAVDYLGLRPEDRISSHPRIHFDLSILDIFGCFAAGATLCPVMNGIDRFLPGKFILGQRISVWISVPSILGTMYKGKQLSPGMYAETLRLAAFCGEALLPHTARAFQETNPQMVIHNLYGPTEATCACTFYRVDTSQLQSNRPVPIGTPNPNTEILILKEDEDTPVLPNEIGRLMICGSQLAHGYWKNPQQTAVSFISNPFKPEFESRMYETGDRAFMDSEGVLQYVGRLDSQVKFMGYRIELGEIEETLNAHPDVVESAVCFMDGQQPEIVAALALLHEPTDCQKASAFQEHCRRFLPEYMVPAHVIIYDALPKSPNGKIDKKAIKATLSTPQPKA